MTKIRNIPLYCCSIILACYTLLVSSSSPVCFTKPYITSIFKIEFSEGKTNDGESYYNFVFDLESNYDSSRIVRIQNVVLTYGLTINRTSNPLITFNKFERNEEKIAYSRWMYKNEKRVFGKKSYYEMIERRYNEKGLARNNISALDLTSSCDPISIGNRALYGFMINDTHLLHVQYAKSARCFHIMSEDPESYSPIEFVKPLKEKLDTNILSAYYKAPFLFEFTADGYLNLYKFGPKNSPSIKEPMGDPNVARTLFRLTTVPFDDSVVSSSEEEEKAALFENRGCKSDPNVMPNFDVNTLVNEHSVVKPLRTLSMLNDTAYIASFSTRRPAEKKDKLYVIWLRRSASGPFIADTNVKLIQILPREFRQFSLEVISITRIEEKNVWQVQAIFSHDTAKSLAYCKRELKSIDLPLKFEISVNGSDYIDGNTFPDDITHWSVCKKVVSVYGFLYGLHDYNDNILTKETKWQILPEEHFDYPIEAVHSNGDEFWFVLKSSTVLVFKVDSNDCSKLVFTKKKIINLQQVFDPSVKNVLTEERFYSNGAWNPRWNWVPKGDWITIGDEVVVSSLLWLYVGIFITIVALIVIVILMMSNMRKPLGTFYTSRVQSPGSKKSSIKRTLPRANLTTQQSAFAIRPSVRSEMSPKKKTNSPGNQSNSPGSPIRSDKSQESLKSTPRSPLSMSSKNLIGSKSVKKSILKR